MKTITKLFLLASFLCFLTGNAQAPNKFSFQAVVRNSSNQLIANQTVGVKISLISVVMSSENAEFEETHTVTTNANGLFSLKVGEGTLVSGDFISAMSSVASSKKIKCEIDPTGGTNYTIESNEQLLSVPYALKANNATYANNADFATNATNATSATSANSVVGIAGNEGSIPVFGKNNTLGNSTIYNESESGNVGIYNQNPIVALDVAGNGTILARNRVVLGPVGGNPQISPVWAVDNSNYEFRVFKQPDISTPGTTHFAINATGNATMSNNLNVVGDISTNKITAGNNSYIGVDSMIGNNVIIQSGAKIAATESIKIGYSGNQISNILFGTAVIGPRSFPSSYTDVKFQSPMPNTNYVVNLTVEQEGFLRDEFIVHYVQKSINGFGIFVKRLDGDSWSQNLKVDWTVICGK